MYVSILKHVSIFFIALKRAMVLYNGSERGEKKRKKRKEKRGKVELVNYRFYGFFKAGITLKELKKNSEKTTGEA